MQSLPIPVVSPATVTLAPPRQASHDAELIRMWLHGRCENTRRPYQRHVGNFLRLVGRPLGHVTVGDVQDFADTLTPAVARPGLRRLGRPPPWPQRDPGNAADDR